MTSVIASMATAELCKQLLVAQGEDEDKVNFLSFTETWPCFDCRCFNIPEREIANYYWWRLLDSKRNSINMQAQDKFSHKELQGKTCDQMQEMLFKEHGINWGKLPAEVKAGFICQRSKIKKLVEKGPNAGKEFERSVWNSVPAPATKEALDLALEAALAPPVSA